MIAAVRRTLRVPVEQGRSPLPDRSEDHDVACPATGADDLAIGADPHATIDECLRPGVVRLVGDLGTVLPVGAISIGDEMDAMVSILPDVTPLD